MSTDKFPIDTNKATIISYTQSMLAGVFGSNDDLKSNQYREL